MVEKNEESIRKPLDKAMIIIAVSKYKGVFSDLPGTITSAQRLRQWAQNESEDRNYNVLYLTDEEYEEITVELLSEKIEPFLKNNYIDRLVVYFAGHGFVRSLGDQFWLLTNAAENAKQGINVEQFRRQLMKYNIGANNADLYEGQLCLIGDACRNSDDAAREFLGDAILSSTRRPANLELDRFLSTSLGDYSHQIRATGSTEAFCLFSEILIDALEGNVASAIETVHHEFSPAVINYSLKKYLQEEVKKRAAAINEVMEPDISTAITPPYNIYRKLIGPIATKTTQPGAWQITANDHAPYAEPMGTDWIDGRSYSEREEIANQKIFHLNKIIESDKAQFVEKYLTLQDNDRDFLTETGHAELMTAVISDFKPNNIFIPRFTSANWEPLDDKYSLIKTTPLDGYPILIKNENEWTLVPDYPRVVLMLFERLSGDTLIFRPENLSWDSFLSDFSNFQTGVPLKSSDARHIGDNARYGKKKYPHQAVVAGYLYEFSNDYANIARTAHYMAIEGDQVVPFDLALLCAEKIYWEQNDDKWIAFADLPSVPEQFSVNGSVDETDAVRPEFTRVQFGPRTRVPLWGICPIYRQGWTFLQYANHLEIPEGIRKICNEVRGRSATNLTEKGLEAFVQFFKYQLVDLNIMKNETNELDN